MRRFTAFFLLAGCATQGTDVQIQAASGDGGSDIRGPVITIDSPIAGDWSGEGSITVTGTVVDIESGVTSATINGRALPMRGTARGRAISAPVTLKPGINTITITATDVAGNTTEHQLSVMGGMALPMGTAIRGAAIVEVNGPMMDMLAEPMGNNFGSRELITDSVDQTVWSDCAVFDGAVESISLGDAIVTVTPGEDGLSVTAAFATVTAQYSGTADLCGVEEPFSITLSHPSPNYAATVSLSVTDGAISAEVVESSVDLSGAMITSDVDEALSDQGISMDDMGISDVIAEMIAASMDATMPVAMPIAVGAVIPDGVGVQSMGLVDITYTMDEVRTDESGIGIAYEASIPADENAVNVAPGAIVMAFGGMSRNGDAPVSSSTSLNLINNAIHSAWESGVISAYVNAEDKGLTVTTWPTMPPVIHPGETPTMRLGELHVDIRNEDELVARLSVQASADITFDSDKAGNPVMVATLTDSFYSVTEGTLSSELSSEITEVIQGTFDAAVPRMVNQQTAAAELEAVGVETTGNNSDWITTSYIATPW
jgi:hypothetical protein